MASQRQRAKQPVNPALAGPYGHPYHPILVTIPIGSWVASLVFDLASHLVSGPAFLAQGSVWLIGLGVAGALLAGSVGLLDLLAIPPGTRAHRVALTHMSLNLSVTAAYVGNLVWRASGYPPHEPVGVGMIALSLVSLGALTVSGYLGGMLAYRYGVRVADDASQGEGFRT